MGGPESFPKEIRLCYQETRVLLILFPKDLVEQLLTKNDPDGLSRKPSRNVLILLGKAYSRDLIIYPSMRNCILVNLFCLFPHHSTPSRHFPSRPYNLLKV